MNSWPPKPREHGHAENQVDLVEIRVERLEGGVGVGRQSGPHPEAPDPAEERLGVTDLDVHGERVGAGVAKRFEVATRLRHHEVAVEEQPRMRAQRAHDGRPDGEVGDEVAVHHVDVQPIGRAGDLPDRLGQVAEVGRQHRRGDLDAPG